MWTNLLSGTIGAVIGVLGTFVAAVVAFQLTRREDARRTRHEYTIRVSGELASALVEFYDAVRHETLEADNDESLVALSDLHAPADALRRAITVDGPLLPLALELSLGETRKMIKETVPRAGTHATAGDLRRLLDEIRPAGDRLRDLRRDWYQSAPPGMKLG